MEQTNVKRLLHTMAPFLIMVLSQRLLTLLTGRLGLTGALAELLAFLPSAAVGLALFRLRTFDVQEDGGGDSVPLEVGPLIPESRTVCVLAVFASSAIMILLMWGFSAIFSGGFDTRADTTAAGAISLLLIHPLVEEYVFRWRFYRSLREMSPIFGCLAQAVMFAIMHSSVQGMIYALTGGVMLAFTVEETGVLWSAVAAHILVNLRTYCYIGVLAEHPAARQRIDGVLYVLGLAAAVGIVVIRSRRFRAQKEPETPETLPWEQDDEPEKPDETDGDMPS